MTQFLSQYGHRGYFEILTRNKLYQCHHLTSSISNTIFADTKLPLTIWFLTIYLFTQSKYGMSSLSKSRTLGISASAAFRMKHTLQQAMKQRADSQPLHGILLLDDAYCGGKKRDGKRGRWASDKMPFVAALTITSKGHPTTLRLSHVASFTQQEITAWSAKHLSPGSLVVSDGFNCFPGVTQAGCDHEPIITYTGPEYDEFKVFKWVNTMIGNVKEAIHGTCHAKSKKHLPRYPAEFCYRFNRRFELHEMVNGLVYVAVRTQPIPQRILKLAEIRW